MRHVAAGVASSALAAIGIVHIAWGRGSAWPLGDREGLADAVVGSPAVPGPASCYLVGGAVLAAGALVAGAGGAGRAATAARWGVTTALGARGVLGGRVATKALGLPRPSQRFVDLDTRIYRPLCLTLAALTGLAARRPRGSARPGRR